MDIDLSSRTAFVTGSARNIGEAIARSLGAAGARVICGYLGSEADAERTVADIVAGGGDAIAQQVDVADPTSVAGATAASGPVDILVNNAAIRPRRRIEEVTAEEFDQVIAINLRGPFLMAQAAVPHMRQQGWGRIINLGGTDAYYGNPMRPPVVASKMGVVGLSRALANETARWGITVNTLVPGVTDTIRDHPDWHPNPDEVYATKLERIPAARLGTPQDVAAACVFLASDHAGYITGQELVVSGGMVPLVRQRESEYE